VYGAIAVNFQKIRVFVVNAPFMTVPVILTARALDGRSAGEYGGSGLAASSLLTTAAL
jgi:hypothetical protein